MTNCIWMAAMVAFIAGSGLSLLGQERPPQGQSTENRNAPLRVDESYFERFVAPILKKSCLRCHNDEKRDGDIRLTTRHNVVVSQGSGVVAAGDLKASELWDAVSGASPRMPKSGGALSPAELEVIRRWIESGAPWSDTLHLAYEPLDWWSLRPIEDVSSTVEELVRSLPSQDEMRSPIDLLVRSQLASRGLTASPEADRRTLLRRLYYDLLGVPPSVEEIEEFDQDPSPDAYEQRVDRLLSSPQYGERWARHWLDAVHYGDTHGYDKDKLRPNAWPYRDYVIRSFNFDKPYDQFVLEQIAGDSVAASSSDGTEALGFLSAGPFDFVGQIEVADGTMEKERVRNIDRDDMLSATLNTFASTTFQCARCHDHKFDPIPQKDYYQLQSVFAGVDRADVPYDPDPMVREERQRLLQEKESLQRRLDQIDTSIDEQIGIEGHSLKGRMQAVQQSTGKVGNATPEFGYHSQIATAPDQLKWVQVDLGEAIVLKKIVVRKAYDDFGGIGAGFGFPIEWRVEVSNDPQFVPGSSTVVPFDEGTNGTIRDLVPVELAGISMPVRYVRVTATRLAKRTEDFIFALAELQAFDCQGENRALHKEVAALDSIEAPVRWRKSNLVDGIFPSAPSELDTLRKELDQLIATRVDSRTAERRRACLADRTAIDHQLAALPKQQLVYSAATHFAPVGSFRPTGGKPRPVHVLSRGNEQSKLEAVVPKGPVCLPPLQSIFDAHDMDDERQRRLALGRWLVHEQNPLTWRSIVNRVWYHHMGAGIVESLNDFGRMGSEPTNLLLLDWLANEFRDSDRSLKQLHRLIVTSATYRQSSAFHVANSEIDANNQYLWRMNRRRLDAESIRDSVLEISGRLRNDMGGPGFYLFGLVDDHSPHYLYEKHDPDDPQSHRRSIYRFIVRSAPDPFLTTLDCADASILVDRRNETLTALQSLSMLNNPFMLRMSENFAKRIESTVLLADDEMTAHERLERAFLYALGRRPIPAERDVFLELYRNHGLSAVCRALLNSNEFVFVD